MSNPALCDLSPVADHPALGTILVKSGSQIDLRPLTTLAWLRSVHLSYHCVTNVEALRNCAHLESIALNGLPDIDDVIRFIPDHPLKQLELSNGSLSELTSLAKIPGLAALEGLNLMDCECPSLRGVEHWARTLRRLRLWGLSDLIDLTPLTKLSGLRSLSLIYGTPQDLRVVRGMSSLQELYLWDKRPVDITPLRGMRRLTVRIDSRQEVHGAELLGEGSELVRG